MKKQLSTLITLFCLIFILGLNVCAASGPVKIGSKAYPTLEKAFASVKKGQTIILKQNITVSGDLKLNLGKKSVSLNLNNKTLTMKESRSRK